MVFFTFLFCWWFLCALTVFSYETMLREIWQRPLWLMHPKLKTFLILFLVWPLYVISQTFRNFNGYGFYYWAISKFFFIVFLISYTFVLAFKDTSFDEEIYHSAFIILGVVVYYLSGALRKQ